MPELSLSSINNIYFEYCFIHVLSWLDHHRNTGPASDAGTKAGLVVFYSH